MTEDHWLTLLSVFFMGLALNLTPCVYPMISVTVSLFGRQKDSRRGEAFLRALVYVLGMVIMYSSLGVLAALGGSFFGAFLQNRWVLSGIGILIFALALSLFGFFSFQLPAGLLTRLSRQRSLGLIGFFLSGFCVGMIAAPCIGPPIVALMAFVGSQGDPASAVLIFFVMALGLGIPYLLLGTFSGLLHRLPRSGVWLVWVERFFAVVLLGVAVFYLFLAWYPAAVAYLWPAALIAGGCYLGFLEKAGNESRSFKSFKRFLGVLAVLFACLYVFSYPIPRVTWETYTPQKLEKAQEEGRPVIIDFFAEWCFACHELEQRTYADPHVIEALEPFVRLKVDLTHPEGESMFEALERFAIIGVPTVLFLDPNGEEILEARITGFVSPEELLTIVSFPRLRVDDQVPTPGLDSQNEIP